MRTKLTSLALAMWVLSGCSQTPPNKVDGNAKAEQPEAPKSAANANEPCADDGPRLPISGLCKGRAVNYLEFATQERPQAPEGCEWEVGEVAMPADEILLYLGTKCGDKTTKLEFTGGAKSAEISYISSGQAGDAVKGEKFITVISEGDAPNPESNLLSWSREAIEDTAQRDKCVARTMPGPDAPKDGWIVDITAEEEAKAPTDEPRVGVCGPYGYTDDASYWRVFGGFSWHFKLGQDVPDLDTDSFTLIQKPSDEPAADGKAN